MRRKGFTLIELLIVVAIIGILAAIAIPRYQNALASARGAKIVAELRMIDSASALYAARVGSYPTSLEQLTGSDTTVTPPKLPLVVVDPAPEGQNFIVEQNSGAEKSFQVAAGTQYILRDGRATYDGNEKTVEWYLTADNFLSALLGDIRSWQNSNAVTGTVNNHSYYAAQKGFEADNMAVALTDAQVAQLLPGYDTSSFGQLYLKSATAVLADGSIADIQYVSKLAGTDSSSEAKTYIACAFIVNGKAYVNMGAHDNTPTMSSYLPGSGGLNTATAVQSLYNKTDTSSFVNILLSSHYKELA